MNSEWINKMQTMKTQIFVCSTGNNKTYTNKQTRNQNQQQRICWRWFHENFPANIHTMLSEKSCQAHCQERMNLMGQQVTAYCHVSGGLVEVSPVTSLPCEQV